MSNNFRVSGLVSGLDTDQIIKDLMKIQRARVDQIAQKKEQAEWKRSDYRTLNNSIRALRDAAFDMKLEGPYQAKKVSSSSEAAVVATASSSTAVGSYTVSVSQLAQGISKGSQGAVPEETKADGTLKTLKEQFSLPDSITFTLEGKLKTDGSGERQSKVFTIDTTVATIGTMTAAINQHSSTLGIMASYDSTNNRFFMSTNGTGSDFGIRVTADSANLLSDPDGSGSGKLKMLLQTDSLYQGQNAQFSFGDTPAMTSSTNSVTVNGINLTLRQGGGATSTISVQRDTDAIYNSIKSFVDQYNSTLDTINKKLSEERYSGYLPLTDEQKEQLSEKQQEQWEEKAKSGMLRNDQHLYGLASRIREKMSSVLTGVSAVMVEGKSVTYNSMASIGIVTGLYTEKGKLQLKNNGEDLRKAIENDPQGVQQLFTKQSDIASERGIAQGLYDKLNNDFNEIVKKAGVESIYNLYDDSFLGETINRYAKQIKTMEGRLDDVKDRYYKQYSALESALNKLNSQSNWLTQQFNSSSSSR